MSLPLHSGPPGGASQGYGPQPPTGESSRQELLNLSPTVRPVDQVVPLPSAPVLTLHPDVLRAALVLAAGYLLGKVIRWP